MSSNDFFVDTYCAEGGYYALLICVLVYGLWIRGSRRSLPWIIFMLFLGMRVARDTITVILLLSEHLSAHRNALYLKIIGILDISAFGVLFLVTYMLVMLAAPTTSEVNSGPRSLGFTGIIPATGLIVLLVIGMVLGGIGQSKFVTLQDSLSSLTTLGHNLTKAGLDFYTIAYVLIVVIHTLLGVSCWASLSCKVFAKMSVALALLLVRLTYRWLNEVGGPQWSPLNGTWRFFLALGGIMEWIIAGLYVILAFITRPRPLLAPEPYYVRQLIGNFENENENEIKASLVGSYKNVLEA